MRQEVILQHKLQKALWCGKGGCPTIHERWVGLRDEVITHSKKSEVLSAVEQIMHFQHNLFGYPNEERGLWLEFEGDGMRQYYEKEKAEVVYFVGCKTSFLISQHQQAVNVVKGLQKAKVDFAVLGSREWCCGMPLKKLGMNKEFRICKEHNLLQIQNLQAKEVIYTCPSCYFFWQQEYQPAGIELVYKVSRN